MQNLLTTASALPLADLLGLLSQTGRTGRLQIAVKGAEGDQVHRLYLRDGALLQGGRVDCPTVDRRAREERIIDTLALGMQADGDNVIYSFEVCEVEFELAPLPVMGLLLEAGRRTDDALRAAA